MLSSEVCLNKIIKCMHLYTTAINHTNVYWFKYGLQTMGYSYDITVSTLSFNSGGAHEIGISILIGDDEQKVDYNDCFLLFR